MIEQKQTIQFPNYSGIRCLMMPYIQGDPNSVPDQYAAYRGIIEEIFFEKGDIGFLTIDESPVKAGNPHRGDRAKYGRAIHTEVGAVVEGIYCWGSRRWGLGTEVEVEEDVKVLLANNLDGSCALWNAVQKETTPDGDIGHLAHLYPYEDAILMKSGEVWQIGILTPHESLPVKEDYNRQFLRIVSSGIHGREAYFTENPLVKV